MRTRIVLLGPPLAGKGTQGRLLAGRLGVPHIATGELIADEVAAGGVLGRRAARYVDRGDLLPDEVVIDLVRDRLARADCAGGYLLDGFPRTAAQARALAELSGVAPPGIVVDLRVPETELMDRLVLRAREQGRSDDDVATLRHRIAVFDEQTAPLRDYYTGRGILRRVDGTGDAGDVFERILTAVRSPGPVPAREPDGHR